MQDPNASESLSMTILQSQQSRIERTTISSHSVNYHVPTCLPVLYGAQPEIVGTSSVPELLSWVKMAFKEELVCTRSFHKTQCHGTTNIKGLCMETVLQ